MNEEKFSINDVVLLLQKHEDWTDYVVDYYERVKFDELRMIDWGDEN